MSKPRKMPNEDIIKRQAKEIRELRDLCSEVYQVVGQFMLEDDALDIEKIMDALSSAANGEGFHPKQGFLPWHLPPGAEAALDRFVAMKKLETLHVADA